MRDWRARRGREAATLDAYLDGLAGLLDRLARHAAATYAHPLAAEAAIAAADLRDPRGLRRLIATGPPRPGAGNNRR